MENASDLVKTFDEEVAKYRDSLEKKLKAVSEARDNISLNYKHVEHSEMSGKLNQMRVVKPGEKTNVCLAWEGVNEVKGKKSFCQYWRVLVIAIRDIMPLDELIRPP